MICLFLCRLAQREMYAYKEFVVKFKRVVVPMVQPQSVDPTQGPHKKARVEGVRKTGEKKEKEIDDDVDDTLKAIKTKKLKGIAETNDELQVSPDVQLLLYLTKTSKLSRRERLIFELSRGPEEGSAVKNESQDDKDSLDSNKTLNAPRLETVIDKGEEDDALNFMICVHGKQYDVKDKETPIYITISSPRTRSSQDDVLHYLNETPTPSLRDVRLLRPAGMSGLDSHDESYRKENPSGDSVDLEWLIQFDDDPIPSHPIKTIITTKLTTSRRKKFTSRIITKVKRFNPMAKKLKALQENVKEQQRKMDEFIANKVPTAVQELVPAQVIQEVKNHAPTLVHVVVANIVRPCIHTVVSHVLCTEHISLTTTPALSSTNITILELKVRLYEMMSNNPESIKGKINNDLCIAPSESIHQDKQDFPKDSCRDANLKKRTHNDLENHEWEKRYKQLDFVGQSSLRNDQVMFEASDHERQTSSAEKTREDPRWFDRLPVELNLSKMEEFMKDGYELFGNRFMSKAEYDYNMDQMKIAMSNDMDWDRDHGLGVDSKEPLSLVGPKLSQRIPLEHFFNEDLEYLKIKNKDLRGRKYALFITKRHAAEYNISWINEDIGRLFRNTLVEYDVDVMLGIHHWPKTKKLAYRGKRFVATVGKVYSDLKITFVDAVKVDLLLEYGFLKSIIVTRADEKKYTFKESDFSRLNLNNIKDMYVLKAQRKLKHLGGTTKYYLMQSLLVFMRSVIIKKRVEDVQLCVESY
nr:hypothetical protein [Tanacetum cinerariifolium]